jgi:alkylation response protein AidB-like acyl-CoA dehydrogenase
MILPEEQVPMRDAVIRPFAAEFDACAVDMAALSRGSGSVADPCGVVEPIGEHQGRGSLRADMAEDAHAARRLSHDAARRMDLGEDATTPRIDEGTPLIRRTIVARAPLEHGAVA